MGTNNRCDIFLFLHTKWFWNAFRRESFFWLVCGTRREFLLSPFLGCSRGESHMTTEATGDIPRNFVERFASESGDVRFTAHSLKATALSWCAMFGLKMGARRLLCSHKKKR